jgi:hypothetical protein
MRNPFKLALKWLRREKTISETIHPAPAPRTARLGPKLHNRRKIRGAFGHAKGPFDPRPALRPAQMRELAKTLQAARGKSA